MASVDEIKAATDGSTAMGPFGSDIRKENYRPCGVPIIRGLNLNAERFLDSRFVFLSEQKADELSRSSAFPGDIVFTAQGSIGQVGIIPKDAQYKRYVLSQNLMKVTCDPTRADPLYVFYYFRSAQGQQEIMSYVNPTGVPCISRPLTSMRAFQLALPPLSEQHAIARILGAFDDKIELNRRMNETLEAMAQALFKSWFVDFDPVRAKAEGRPPTGLDPATAALFPDGFEDSALGEVPRGWGTQTLNCLLSLDKGISYKGQFLTESGMPMVNLGCFLGHGRFAEKAIKNYSGEYQPRHVVRPLDLVLANTDITQQREVIGSPAIIPPREGVAELIFSHHVYAARFRHGHEGWRLFVYFVLLQDGFRQRASGFATGTTVLALPRDAVLEMRCPAPPPMLLSAFNDTVYPLLRRQWQTTEESRTLAALRDALLPKLLSGEVRVKAATP